MSDDIEILGGAGPYETAAIVAAITAILDEIARSREALRPSRPQNRWAGPSLRQPLGESWSPIRPAANSEETLG